MPLDAHPSYADLMDKHGFVPANHAAPQFFPVSALRVYDEKGTELPGYRRIVREDTGHTLNVCTDAYKLVTNEDAFGAFETALEESKLDLSGMRIGTDYSAGGARCFRQYLLPAHQVEVRPGALVALRLLMMNSYDGSLAFQGRAGAFNFVCANTSVMGKDIAGFKMRHAGGLDIGKAIGALTEAAEAHVTEMQRLRRWPQITLDDYQAMDLIKGVPLVTPALSDHLVHRWILAKNETGANGGANLWAFYNALTAWSTHSDAKGAANGLVGANAPAPNRAQTRWEREVRIQKTVDAPAWRALEAA